MPPGASLDAGFARARDILDTRRPVRLVGEGVTHREVWPAWVRERPGLMLTELAAYQVTVTEARWAEFESGVAHWIDTWFADVLPGLAPSVVLHDAAMNRLFADARAALPLVLGLLEHFEPKRRVDCVDPQWIGLSMLATLQHVESDPTPTSRERWRRDFAWAVARGWFHVLGQALGEHLAHRRDRGTVARLRAWQTTSPDAWVAGSREQLASARVKVWSDARPGHTVGIMLQGGAAGFETMDGRRGMDRTEPMTFAETWADLARALLRTAERSLTLCRQAARMQLPAALVRANGVPIDPKALAAMGTEDMWRASIAELSMRRVMKRHDLHGREVLVVTPPDESPVASAVARALLHVAGAEVEHAKSSVRSGC